MRRKEMIVMQTKDVRARTSGCIARTAPFPPHDKCLCCQAPPLSLRCSDNERLSPITPMGGLGGYAPNRCASVSGYQGPKPGGFPRGPVTRAPLGGGARGGGAPGREWIHKERSRAPLLMTEVRKHEFSISERRDCTDVMSTEKKVFQFY